MLEESEEALILHWDAFSHPARAGKLFSFWHLQLTLPVQHKGLFVTILPLLAIEINVYWL